MRCSVSVEQPVPSCSGSGVTEREDAVGDITGDGEVSQIISAGREQLRTAALLSYFGAAGDSGSTGWSRGDAYPCVFPTPYPSLRDQIGEPQQLR